MQALHIIHHADPAAAAAHAAAALIAAHDHDHTHHIISLGPPRENLPIARLRAGPPPPPPRRAYPPFAPQRLAGATVIHAWSLTALQWVQAHKATSRSCATLIAPPHDGMTTLERHAARAALAALPKAQHPPAPSAPASPSRLQFTSAWVRQCWASALHDDAILNCPVLPLPAPPAPDPTLRSTIRRGWNLDPDDTRVICDISDPPETRDALRLSYLAGVAAIAGFPALAVINPRSRRLSITHRTLDDHDHRWRIALDDRPTADIIAAADIAVWLSDPWLRAGLPTRNQPAVADNLAIAAAAGVPIVAEDHPAAREAVGDQGAIFITPVDPLAAHRAVHALCANPASAATHTQAAQAHLAHRPTPQAWAAAIFCKSGSPFHPQAAHFPSSSREQTQGASTA